MLQAKDSHVPIMQYNLAEGFMSDESHFHRHYEIYYLLKGKRRYIIENTIYDIQAGDIILIPPMLMHRTQRVPGTDQKEIHERILFNLKEVPAILKPCFNQCFYRPSDEIKESIKALIEESLKEENKSEESRFLHKLNVHKILLMLLRMPIKELEVQELDERDRLMQNAACYIKEHCHNHLTLKDMADIMGFTPEYFSSLFKTSIGLNFVDYLNNMRIAKAILYLNQTDLPISVISEKCGFNDSNYFAIVFKKIVGISPRNYRNSLDK